MGGYHIRGTSLFEGSLFGGMEGESSLALQLSQSRNVPSVYTYKNLEKSPVQTHRDSSQPKKGEKKETP